MFTRGQRIQIPVHYDPWMRGARYGEVRGFRHGNPGQSDYYLVRLDAMPKGRCLKLWRLDWPYAEVVS